MTKLEYTDFHKFIASLGVGLIALAGIFPWLFLREPFDLYIEKEKLEAISPIAKSIIENRQSLVSNFIVWIPIVSITLLILGLICLIFGLWRWKAKQSIQDKTEQMKFDDLQKSARMSSEEVKEKGLQDLNEIDPSSVVPEKIMNSSEVGIIFGGPALNTYLEVEAKVVARMKTTIHPSLGLEVLDRRKIGYREFDAVLARKSGKLPDVLVEIKYYAKPPSRDLFYRLRDRLVSTAVDYSRATGRKGKGLAVIVVKNKVVKNAVLDRWIRPIADLSKKPISIPMFVIEESRLDDINFGDLLSGEPKLNSPTEESSEG